MKPHRKILRHAFTKLTFPCFFMRYNFRIGIKKFLLINFGLKRIALPNYVCAVACNLLQNAATFSFEGTLGYL